MGDNHSLLSLYGKSALYQLFISLVIVLVVGSILFSVFFLTGKLVFDTDQFLLNKPSSQVGESDIAFLKFILISQHISFFIIPSLVLLIALNPAKKKGLTGIKVPMINEIVLVIILTFCTFPVTGFAGQLNAGMHLPWWLSGVEQWMTAKEKGVNRIVEIIMSENNFWAMLLNLLMVAVLPAIGEELLFRGVFQKIFYTLFKSGHLAIWVTAFIFSALHLQFFGFLPRFILGLIFGYLFYWSGTLWLPVISHFVNNSVSVIAAYIQGWTKVSELQDIPFWKHITALVFPVLICLLIMQYFRKKNLMKETKYLNESDLEA
jgi:membrane protease YdiL (CAAX protease family)